MNTFLAVLVLIIGGSAQAQPAADPLSTGMALNSTQGCPVIVAGVVAGSPAGRAGIRSGDRLVAVDGTRITGGDQAARLMRSNPDAAVSLTLMRLDREIRLTVEREKRSAIYQRVGQKVMSGAIVPADTVQAEVDRMLAFDGRRYVARVFPTHYPADPERYYGGFEIFVLRDPAQVAVGGVEQGPATAAGVHWGDILVAANDVAVEGKTPAGLEQMFSASRALPMRLRIDRLGAAKTFEFQLQRADEVARRNGKRFVSGQLVPIGIADQDLPCFLKP